MKDETSVLLVKIGFVILCFLEAFICGTLPTFIPSCRENPKVMGIANSFAAGVFIAIALMHLTPEMIEVWDELPRNEELDKIFPLPEMLTFIGYTLILILDKVLFDTHSLFDDHGHGHAHNDPAAANLEHNLRASMVKQQRTA